MTCRPYHFSPPRAQRETPNGDFARRAGLPAYKRPLLSVAGRKYDRMAAVRGQRYAFVFVHEDGAGLARVSDILDERKVKASVDQVFDFADINAAMAKVAGGGSRGKTILRIG